MRFTPLTFLKLNEIEHGIAVCMSLLIDIRGIRGALNSSLLLTQLHPCAQLGRLLFNLLDTCHIIDGKNEVHHAAASPSCVSEAH